MRVESFRDRDGTMVPRPRLAQRLDEGRGRGLILVCAPAGYGKTVLLTEWVRRGRQPVHESLGFLLEHRPPGLHLALTSRSDPPLALARLRARGQLTELRAAELRFTLVPAPGPAAPVRRRWFARTAAGHRWWTLSLIAAVVLADAFGIALAVAHQHFAVS